MKADLERIRDWLEKTRSHPEFRFQSYEALILEQGRPYTQGAPFENRGPMRECYSNALSAAIHNPDLTYCEGYAVSGIITLPVQHAWVVNEAGEAIEVTWPYQNVQYYGIALNTDFVAGHTLRTGYHGVICNDWLDNHSLLRTGVPQEAIPNI